MICLEISVACREDKERLRVNGGVYRTFPLVKAEEKRGYDIPFHSDCLVSLSPSGAAPKRSG